MTAPPRLELAMDSVSVFSPGGELLQVELAAALDRTCPEGAGAVVLKRPEQTGIGGYERIRAQSIGRPIAGRWQKWRWVRAGLPAWVRRLGADVVFVGSGLFAPRLPATCGVVATTNNLAPFSREQLEAGGISARLRFAVTRRLIVRGLRTADTVVLHSQHALKMLSGHAGDIGPKTTVVLTGVPREMRLDDGAPPPAHPYGGRPYFLYLSAIRWYKNHLRLIEAYRRLCRRIDDLPDLLLMGITKDFACERAIRRAIAEPALAGRVRFLGEVAGDELPAWLHHATVNVFPSLLETNSVIQAEILGMRGVMATSAIPPMSEVAGEAAELFDPRDGDDMARALERLWRSPERRDELRRRAARRAAELSWDACGEAIWQAARDAADLWRARRR